MKNKEPKVTIEQEPAPALTGRGGAGRGQGRHFHAMPLERLVSIRLTPESEDDYRIMLEMTTPKIRFALLVAEAKRLQAYFESNRIQALRAKRRYSADMLEEAADRLRAEDAERQKQA